ncbi:cupin domain-containing protein [Pelagovum pacificum]|uniref:Cupin domain-containing protein n=2 Tax=Pelagovum pacificum TaxID=2588711 RepID=A0A5C5GJJ4_9RHOB|nr:cupin domain-containing protein [Pelagovum pacificum]
MGRIGATFKADAAETGGRSSVSEWRLEPDCAGPGAHRHEAEDEVFYVLAGQPSVLVGDTWHRLKPGACVYVPAGVMHDFCNPGAEAAVLLNVFIGAGFEKDMPMVSAWFAENPVGAAPEAAG